MSAQDLVERLERIKPGIENSNSSAEDAMVEIMPSVIEAMKRLAQVEASVSPGAILTEEVA